MNFLIGHSNNDLTGCSVIIAPNGAVGGVSVRGGAPGTRETDLLKSENTVDKVNAVVLTGGSAYGLASCDGVMRYLYENRIGFNAGSQIVPIVCGAVLYDLRQGELVYPDANFGYEACKNAVEISKINSQKNTKKIPKKNKKIGAGTGATIGKILSPLGVSEGGLGLSIVELGGVKVGAMVAVNALGDVFDHTSGKILSGCRLNDGSFLGTSDAIISGKLFEIMAQKNTINTQKFEGKNTTIGVIFTNASLTKPQANKLAEIGHDGLAQSIKPVHTAFDGDTLFALSSAEVEFDFNLLCVLAVEAVSRAVTDAVTDQ